MFQCIFVFWYVWEKVVWATESKPLFLQCEYSCYFILHLLMVTAFACVLLRLRIFFPFSSIDHLLHRLQHLLRVRKHSRAKLGVDHLTIHWHLKAVWPPFESRHLHTRNLPDHTGQFMVAVRITSSLTVFNIDSSHGFVAYLYKPVVDVEL